MKTYYIFFFFIINSLLFGQKFVFDYGLTQELIGEGKLISKKFKLINSENDDYSMLFYAGNIASIYDRINHVRHEFEAYKNGNHFKLNYLRSCDESYFYKKYIDTNKKKYRYEVDKLNDSIFILNEFRSKNAKKPFCKTVITIKESEVDLLDVLHPIGEEFKTLLKSKLDENKNYTIVKMSYFRYGKRGKDTRLTEIIDMDYEVILPEELNFQYSCSTTYIH